MPRRPHPYAYTQAEGQRVSQGICKRCEQLFSDEYIYDHKEFMLLIQDDPKGYVQIKQILKDHIIRDIIEELSLDNDKKLMYIRKIIVQKSRFLQANSVAIRRIVPFKNCQKQMKFFYIDGFPEGISKTQLLKMLDLRDEVKRVVIRKKHVAYARIYYQNQREVEKKMQEWRMKYKIQTQIFSTHIYNLSVFGNVRSQELNPSTEKVVQSFWMQDMQDGQMVDEDFEKMTGEELQDEKLRDPQDEEQFMGQQQMQMHKIMRNGKIRRQDLQMMKKMNEGNIVNRRQVIKKFNNDILF